MNGYTIEMMQAVRKRDGQRLMTPEEIRQLEVEALERSEAQYRRDLDRFCREWKAEARAIVASQSPSIDLGAIDRQQKLDAALAATKTELAQFRGSLIRLMRMSTPGRNRAPWETPVRRAFLDWAGKNLPPDVQDEFEAQVLDQEADGVLTALFGKPAADTPGPAKPGSLDSPTVLKVGADPMARTY